MVPQEFNVKDCIDIMLDLETLDVGDSPVIIQLSAVKFDRLTGETFDEFSMLINPQSCVKSGLKISGDTLEWWFKQDISVIKKVLTDSILIGRDLRHVLLEFREFLTSDQKEIRVWGNGIMADNVWLSNVYKAEKLEFPIKFWQHSDVRTIVDLGRTLLSADHKKETKFEGDRHNAIDDCKHQIKYVCKIINDLKKG